MNKRGYKTSFFAEQSGNVAMLFGLAIVPLMLLAGGAIDYQRSAAVRSDLRKAADSAALAAAKHAAQLIGKGDPNWSHKGEKIGENVYLSNSRTIANLSPPTPDVDVTKSGQAITARVSYSANVPVQFLKLIGLSSVNVGATVEATAMLPQFANISLVLDVSPSMAIGATAADMTNLKALTLAQTGTACAFACHDIDGAASISNYQIARNGNVTLRIDVVKTAAQTLVNYISTAGVVQSQFTVGLYTLSSSLHTLSAPSSNFGSLIAAIGAVNFDKMSVVTPTLPAPTPQHIASGNSVSHYADTDYTASFTTLNSAVPNDGSGATPYTRQQVAFIVTDGVSDIGADYNASVSAAYVYPPTPNFPQGNDWGKITSPFDTSLCDALKNRGVKVGVLYIPYVADPGDALYQHGVMTNAPPAAVEANLRACASNGLFYEASDLAGITTGLKTLFKSATMNTAAHLSK